MADRYWAMGRGSGVAFKNSAAMCRTRSRAGLVMEGSLRLMAGGEMQSCTVLYICQQPGL